MNDNVLSQIPQDKLIEGRWYVGRGRNANVARWIRIGSRLTFVTIGLRFDDPVIKDEEYYGQETGCFQPFALIQEGVVVEPVGTGPGWDAHYAKRLALQSTEDVTGDDRRAGMVILEGGGNQNNSPVQGHQA